MIDAVLLGKYIASEVCGAGKAEMVIGLEMMRIPFEMMIPTK